MNRILAALAALCLICPAAFAADVAPVNTPGIVLFSGTSPAAPGTSVQPQLVIPLDRMTYCDITARLLGATGGALDVYIQTSNSNGAAGSWKDVVHFPQLAPAAAAIGYSATLMHHSGGTVPVVVNAVDGTPVLAANVVIPSSLGNNLRVVLVAGASTSAGAAQTITAYCASL
jgi:hypothetical protein